MPRGRCSTATAAAPRPRGAGLRSRPRRPDRVRVDGLEPARAQGLLGSQPGAHLAVVPLEDALVEDPIQVMFSGAAEPMRRLFESVRGSRRRGVRVADRVRAPRLLADRHHRSRRHQGPRAGLARAAARASTPEQVMAIGDNFNDLEMLEYAGMPVVMANAVPAPAGARLAARPGTRTSAGWPRQSGATRSAGSS